MCTERQTSSHIAAALTASFAVRPIVNGPWLAMSTTGLRDPRRVAVGAGVALILIGLVKKVAIADYLAREIVDPVFGVPEAWTYRVLRAFHRDAAPAPDSPARLTVR